MRYNELDLRRIPPSPDSSFGRTEVTRRWRSALMAGAFWVSFQAGEACASTTAERIAFNRSIVDYRAAVNRHFPRQTRRATKYIIVHTSEGGLENTLRVVTDGKHNGKRRRTHGGHAHYVIARDGTTYRTLDKDLRADHAGLSLWNGETDISNVSIGIEMVGYHHSRLTEAQYRSLGLLIDILQRIYRLDDRDVLTHSQVAYGRTNRWVKGDHRGRKRCAKNFVRSRAGVGPGWPYDPDVRSGRLKADTELAALYYGPARADQEQEQRIASKAPVALAGIGLPNRSRDVESGSNIVTAMNTAWMIAGEDYDANETLYRLPDGRQVTGERVAEVVGWNRIPAGTEVLLNTTLPAEEAASTDPFHTIDSGRTAWTYAGVDYDKSTTIYFFPDGRIQNGNQISDWDGLPPNTRMLVGYSVHRVTASRPPIVIAGDRYQADETLYRFPDGRFLSGSEITDFRRLPRGVRMYVSIKRS